jgi:hypothetical protein
MKKLILLISGLTLLSQIRPAIAIAQNRGESTVNNPMTSNFNDRQYSRLDWCLNFAKDCGKPVADLFCKQSMHMGAKDFSPAPNVGRTKLITSVYDLDRNVVCNGPTCTGFKYITCYGMLSNGESFPNPIWKGRQLDYCTTFAKDCGKPVADTFCRNNGYSHSIYWRKSPALATKPTRLIGTDELCDPRRGNICNNFGIITCNPQR